MRLLAAAAATLFASAHAAPEQVHVAFGQDPATQMTVSWVTPDAAARPVVQFGLSEGALDGSAAADETLQYEFHSEDYGNYTSGFIHHATVSGLRAFSEVWYRVGDLDKEDFSQTFAARTAAAAGDGRGVTYSVVGDMGQTEYSVDTMQHMLASDSVAVLMPGDASYADSNSTRWDDWARLVEPLAATRPWMMAAGNHEEEQDSLTNETFIAYQSRFKMPEERPFTQDTPWTYNWGNSFYSYDAGSAHFLMLNTYTASLEGSEQYDFAKADLAAVDREVTPWVVVLSHGPVYNNNQDHQNETTTLQFSAAMEPLFYEHGVDLVLHGHVHAYQRSTPVYQEQVMPAGEAPVYVTIGCGGNREELYDQWIDPRPDWVAFRNGTSYGHGELFINETAMEWTWHRNDDEEWVEMDSTVLVR